MKMGDFFNRLVSDFFTSESFWHSEVSDLLKMFPFLHNLPEGHRHTNSKDRYYTLYPYVSKSQDKAYDFIKSSLSSFLQTKELNGKPLPPKSISIYSDILSDMEKCELYFKKSSIVRRMVLLTRWNMNLILDQINIDSVGKCNLEAKLAGISMLPEKAIYTLISKNIQHLEIADSLLLSLPDSIDKLYSMRTLAIVNSKLEYLPSTISFIYNLEKLDLRNNNIKYVPFGIERLNKLKSLNLSGNKIKFLPSYKVFDSFLEKMNIEPSKLLASQKLDGIDNSGLVAETLPQYWAARLGQQPLSNK